MTQKVVIGIIKETKLNQLKQIIIRLKKWKTSQLKPIKLFGLAVKVKFNQIIF